MTGTVPQFEHEKYEELCALATAGVLSPAESVALFTHLNECAACSAMFAEYQNLATDGMDFLRREFARSKSGEFDENKALARLLEAADLPKPQLVPEPSSNESQMRSKRGLWQGLIAASLLGTVAGASYWIGHRPQPAPVAQAGSGSHQAAVQLAAQKRTFENIVSADNQRITALETEAKTGQSELERLRSEAQDASEKLAAATTSFNDSKSKSDAQITALTQDRDASAARVRDAEAKYQAVEGELNTLRSQHQQDLLQVATLEDRVNNLSASLKDTTTRAASDEQYLSTDRDIRDLIGARNLYIADIMDVDESGQSRKPFGRVFYTKTKSLVFYAYDLDRQPGVKLTSTFQVWGRTGVGDKKPVNLGILYMDSETNRRWTLRVDNPQQLSQLDAIFVTIEPRPQMERPTGKPFLVASLRREPNHP